MVMGISKQEAPDNLFDEDLKKPGPKSLKLSKKNLGFLALAIITLQVADAGLLWVVGAPKDSQYADSGIHGHFMSSAVIFCILKFIYTKYKALDETTEEAEIEEDFRQSATQVVDTMKVKRPQEFAPRGAKTEKINSKPTNAQWVPDWLRPPSLNPRAKKFVPAGPSNTLDSDSPAFLPHAYAQKEVQLLKSEYGGDHAGAVVYRSRHWLNEICPDTKEANGPQKSRSPAPTKKVPAAVNAWKKSKASEPVKKWQPKVDPKDIKWTSSWSTFSTACQL